MSELRALAETQRAEREKAEAQHASKTKARADAARQRHLTQVARDVDGVWSKLEEALRGITQTPITSPGILRPVDRGVIGDDGTATVYAMMPSALKLFAEGRLPRVDGDPVEVIIGGQNLGPMVLSEVRCIGENYRNDVAVLVFRRANAEHGT